MILPTPTPVEVERASHAFTSDAPATSLHDAVRLAIATWSDNENLTHVSAKVLLIDRVFSTNVYHPATAVARIVSLRMDGALTAGDPDLVERIATPTEPGHKRLYSFASKYCAMHRPDAYQIFDSRVERALWLYQLEHRFGQFTRDDLWKYAGFMAAVDSFQTRFGLHECTRLELDRFLWTVGGA